MFKYAVAKISGRKNAVEYAHRLTVVVSLAFFEFGLPLVAHLPICFVEFEAAIGTDEPV